MKGVTMSQQADKAAGPTFSVPEPSIIPLRLR
jgi:hypothetical protein